MTYTFDVEPLGKPRMTQRDKWSNRKPVLEYFRFKDAIRLKAMIQNYVPSDSLIIDFYIPFPKSYSKKKCDELLGTFHQEKPDIDNLVKAFLDAFLPSKADQLRNKTDFDDKKVHSITARKFWSEKGKIIVTVQKDTTEVKNRIQEVKDKAYYKFVVEEMGRFV